MDWFHQDTGRLLCVVFEMKICIRSPSRTEGHGAWTGKRIPSSEGFGDDNGTEMIPLGYEGPFFAICSREATDTGTRQARNLWHWSGRTRLVGERARWSYGLDGVYGYGRAEVDSQSRLEKSSAQKHEFSFSQRGLPVRVLRVVCENANTAAKGLLVWRPRNAVGRIMMFVRGSCPRYEWPSAGPVSCDWLHRVTTSSCRSAAQLQLRPQPDSRLASLAHTTACPNTTP